MRFSPFTSLMVRQDGVAAVEFALVSVLFFMMLYLGVFEMARALWTWNAAAEATRYGARLAVVCDINEPNIKKHMKGRLGSLSDANIVIDYLDANGAVSTTCTAQTCSAVRVKLQGYQHRMLIPFIDLSPYLPPFSTTLPKEYMGSAGNAVCSWP